MHKFDHSTIVLFLLSLIRIFLGNEQLYLEMGRVQGGPETTGRWKILIQILSSIKASLRCAENAFKQATVKAKTNKKGGDFFW